MSNVTDFPGGKPINNKFNSSGRDGHLPPEPAAGSTMAEDIPQSATGRPCPVEGRQHTTTLAYSCDNRDPSWEGQQCPCGHT